MNEFEHFCTGHLIILGIIVVFTVLLGILAHKLPERRADILIKALSVLALSCEFLQDVLLTLEGGNILDYLPLHLCNLGLFINIVASFTKGKVRAFFSEVSLVLIAPGSVFALITPDWNYRPLLSWLPLMCFFTHSLVLAIPIMMYIRRYCRPSFKHFWYPYVFLIPVTIPIYTLDKATGRNYMFLLRPISGTPLAWLASFMGNPGYLIGVLVMLAVVLLFVYSLFTVINKLRKV